MTEQQARHRVRELRGLYTNFIWFLVVNALFIVLNLMTSPDSLWFYWITIFWAFGLIVQAIGVYGNFHFFNKQWEDKKVAQLTKK